MSRARIVHIPAPTHHGYRWRWRTDDGAHASTREFDFYYECLSDARAHGHEVELGAAPATVDGNYRMGNIANTGSSLLAVREDVEHRTRPAETDDAG